MENFSSAFRNQVALLDSLNHHNHELHIHSGPNAVENRGIIPIHAPRPQLAGQFFALLHADQSSSVSSSFPCGDQMEPFGSAALNTPSVQCAQVPITSQCGTIGTGWGTDCLRPHGMPAGLHSSPLRNLETESRNNYLYQSCIVPPGTNVLPSRGNDRIFGWPHQNMQEPVSRPPIALRQSLSFQETIDEAVLRLSIPSLNHTAMPPKPASHLSGHPSRSASQPTWHTTYHPRRPLLPDVSLFSYIGYKLDSLDGTFRMQQQVCSQVLRLCTERDPFKTISVIVACILKCGVTRGDPYNTYIAGFCRYFLSKVTDAVVNPDTGRLHSTEPYRRLIHWIFTSTFNKWWTSPPELGSRAYTDSFLVRVASFYGNLHFRKAFEEEAFLGCVYFLSQVKPFPLEGLRSLLSGDISGYPRISPFQELVIVNYNLI